MDPLASPPKQPPIMTVMGFDYGARKIGVAVGQSLTGTATPLEAIKTKKEGVDWPLIERLIKAWHPAQLVVGYPCHMDGSSSSISDAAQQFSEALAARFQLPTTLIDERLSTKAALEAAKQSGYRGSIDALAAAIITETYLRHQPPKTEQPHALRPSI